MRNLRSKLEKMETLYRQGTEPVRRYAIADLMERQNLSAAAWTVRGLRNALQGAGHTEQQWACYLPEMAQMSEEIGK